MEAGDNVGLPPPWLNALLAKKDIYDEKSKCETHPNQYQTFFCKECMGECFCLYCYEESIHNHHPVVRVFRASTKPSIDVDDISEFWNIKNIQHFTINRRTVIFLHEREGKKVNQNGCRICRSALKDYPEYKFCSIECQMRSIEMNGEEEIVPTEEVNATPPSSLNSEILHEARSVGKCSPKPGGVAAMKELILHEARSRGKCSPKPGRVAAVKELIFEAGRQLAVAAEACRPVLPETSSRKRARKGLVRRSALL